MSKIVNNTPKPPYYSVIFTSNRTQGDNGYSEVAEKMLKAAANIDGYLGAESLRNSDGFGITISYWKTLGSINTWKNNSEHMDAKARGKDIWYSEYILRICKVETDNYFVLEKE